MCIYMDIYLARWTHMNIYIYTYIYVRMYTNIFRYMYTCIYERKDPYHMWSIPYVVFHYIYIYM